MRKTKAIVASLFALALVGCKANNSNVDLVIVADSSVPNGGAGIHTLDITVGGDETFHAGYAVSNQITGGGARWVYTPLSTSSNLTFAVLGQDASGATVASGMADVSLKPFPSSPITITLSAFQCMSNCSTAGATRCSGTQVQTCTQMGSCLMWSTAADCPASVGGGDQICCNDVCIPADATNCYKCGTMCSNAMAPTCLPSIKMCGCSLAVGSATNGMGCNTATGQCAACDSPGAAASDYYVDATSKTTGSGTKLCPFKTITSAINAANGSSSTAITIHIAAGTYDATLGETFPLIVRHGITLAGAGASQTIIIGSGNYNHLEQQGVPFTGGAPFGTGSGNLLQATVMIGNTNVNNGLSGLTIKPDPNVASPFGIVCDSGPLTNVPDTPPTNPANTILKNLTIGPGYANGIQVATSTIPSQQGCDMVITGSTITGNQTGIQQGGCGYGTGAGATALQAGDNTAAGANTFTGMINNGNGAGFSHFDCSTVIHLWQNDFGGGDQGAAFGAHVLEPGAPPVDVQVLNNTFHDLTAQGIHVSGEGEITLLAGNTFTHITSTKNNAVAILLDGYGNHLGCGPYIAKARNNTITNNDNGLSIGGAPLVAGQCRGAMDWGTSVDQGNNVFACNASLAQGTTGYDVQIGFTSSASGMVYLSGNIWDHAAADHSAPSVVMSNTAPPNGQDLWENSTNTLPTITTDKATLTNITCDTGRVRGP